MNDIIKRCVCVDDLLKKYRPDTDAPHKDWLVYCIVNEILREEPVIELEVDDENAYNPRKIGWVE